MDAKKPAQNKPAHIATKADAKTDKAHAPQKSKNAKSVAKAKSTDKKPRAKKS